MALISNRVETSSSVPNRDSLVRHRITPSWLITGDTNSLRRFWMLTIAIVVLAACLRLVGLFDDFWFDEIWSWFLAQQSKSVGEIFFGIHHDNNHYLNTLWIYVWGNQPHWYVYRLHSYFAGLVTIVGGGLFAGDVAYDSFTASDGSTTKPVGQNDSRNAPSTNREQFARHCALITMFLMATCEMACVYSTEARGYAMAAAAAVFSTWILRRIDAGSRTTLQQVLSAIGYAVLASLGFLSHLTFASVYLPQLLWSVWRFSVRRRFTIFAICHLPVFVLVGVLWWFDIRLAKIGGAPPTPILQVILDTLTLPTGAVSPEVLVIICAGVVSLRLLLNLRYLAVTDRSDACLFGLFLVCAPPLLWLLRSDSLLTSRHFYVVWMTLFPLLGISPASSSFSSSTRFKFGTLLLLGWIATNGWEFQQFAKYGRGGLQRSVEWLVGEVTRNADKHRGIQTVGSDHDARNGMVLAFYLRRFGNRIPWRYVKQGSWPKQGVDWAIKHDMDRDYVPEPEIHISQHPYKLVHFEPFAAPIGWHWAIYRRTD